MGAGSSGRADFDDLSRASGGRSAPAALVEVGRNGVEAVGEARSELDPSGLSGPDTVNNDEDGGDGAALELNPISSSWSEATGRRALLSRKGSLGARFRRGLPR